MSHNQLIKVGIKLHPKDVNKNWSIEDNAIKLTNEKKLYCFDYVFYQNIKNEYIFNNMVKNIVHAAVKGYNGTIFAYGQTSSGKTYTMIGDEQEPGVMVLSAKEIFSEIEKSSNTRQFLLRGSVIEIYNDKIFDLIKRSDQDLKIHETKNGIPIVNSEELCITTEDELTKMFINGNKERTVGETLMNRRSSRSHAIYRLIIESKEMNNEEEGTVTQSVLFFVDLAGSERTKQTGATGARLKEGCYINRSIFFLRKVIKELSQCQERKYISFRDSKLTRILQPSLGGNALTSIICTVKPSAIYETLSTLDFASCAKQVKNKPHINKTVSDATMFKLLNNEIKDLRCQLDEEKQRTTDEVVKLKELLHYTQLKIINSSSLQHSQIKTNSRRKTWCPDSAHEANTSTSLVANSGPSSRPTSNMAIEEEKFVSDENFGFRALSQCPKTPMGLNVDNGVLNKKLKNENQSLQSEILMLKKRLEEMTPNQNSEQNMVAASNHKLEQQKSLEVNNEREVNHLKEQLRELEEKYDQLQQEFDVLSTIVMKNFDEIDTLQNEKSLAELISKQKRYSNNRNDDIIKDLEEQLREVKESSQQEINKLRSEIKRLTAEQEKMVVTYNSNSSINSSPNKTILQKKKVGDISTTNQQGEDSGISVPFDNFENSSTPMKASEHNLEVQKKQEENEKLKKKILEYEEKFGDLQVQLRKKKKKAVPTHQEEDESSSPEDRRDKDPDWDLKEYISSRRRKNPSKK